MKRTRKARVTDKDNPRNLDDQNWYYGPISKRIKYLTFVHEVYGKDGSYIQTDRFKVPMRFLRDTLFRAAIKAQGGGRAMSRAITEGGKP